MGAVVRLRPDGNNPGRTTPHPSLTGKPAAAPLGQVAGTVSREDDRFETEGIIAFLELQVASGKRQEEAACF
jgi:hypothetical protein